MGRYHPSHPYPVVMDHEKMPWWPEDLQDPQVTKSPPGPHDFPPPRWVQLRLNGSSGAKPPAAISGGGLGDNRRDPWTNHLHHQGFFWSRTKDIPKNACHHKWEMHSSISVVLVYWLRKASMMGLERFQFGHCSGIIILRGDTSIYVNLT